MAESSIMRFELFFLFERIERHTPNFCFLRILIFSSFFPLNFSEEHVFYRILLRKFRLKRPPEGGKISRGSREKKKLKEEKEKKKLKRERENRRAREREREREETDRERERERERERAAFSVCPLPSPLLNKKDVFFFFFFSLS